MFNIQDARLDGIYFPALLRYASHFCTLGLHGFAGGLTPTHSPRP